MDMTILLLLIGVGALIIPQLGGDDGGGDAAPETNEIRGTFDDDTLVGSESADLIYGFQGNDTINGGDGDDEIRPGEGDDTVFAGLGNDYILGSPGNDDLDGGVGNDRIFGGADDDVINGNYGSDLLRGGDGNDTIFGGFDSRVVDGELVPALQSTDAIRGDDGDDTIFIWGGNGTADGSADNDTLVLVTGQASLTAGGGATDAFYALANVTDEQLTEATITDFDPSRDTLTLTIDYVPEGGVLPDVDFTLTDTTVGGVSGVLVQAVFVGPGDVPAESEAATAFLQGATSAQLGAANIQVMLTAEADLFDPEATLAGIAPVT